MIWIFVKKYRDSATNYCVRRCSFASCSGSIFNVFCSIITSCSEFLNLARLIAWLSGLSRLIWYFLVTSKKYVLIIFAINGSNVSSLYLKNAINTKSKKIGIATTNAANFPTPFLYITFQIPNHNPIPIATVISCKIEIEKGPIWTLILNHPPVILRGIKIFCIVSMRNRCLSIWENLLKCKKMSDFTTSSPNHFQ